MAQKTNLSDKLAEIRKRQGFTQESLEAASGVSRRTIQDIERGVNSPSVLTLESLSGALGVPIIEFFETLPAEAINAKGAARSLAQSIKHRKNREEKSQHDGSTTAKFADPFRTMIEDIERLRQESLKNKAGAEVFDALAEAGFFDLDLDAVLPALGIHPSKLRKLRAELKKMKA